MKMPNDKGMTDFEWRSCASKKRYPVEPPLPNMAWRAYPCDFCKGWHLTSGNKNGDVSYTPEGSPPLRT
jgi:hypothetical protein